MPTTTTNRSDLLILAREELRASAHPDSVQVVQRYFKTGPGEYAEGDTFIGVKMPDVRRIARAHRGLSLEGITSLLTSPVHEERMLALVVMSAQYRGARKNPELREQIFQLYIGHTRCINNWDLVDTSAAIVGLHIGAGLADPSLLDTLSRSELVWDRRIALLATQPWIKAGRFDATLRLAETSLRDKHDLIHKAAGWMLREIGQRDPATLMAFLDRHAPEMPRTMLRYAIEKFEPELRRNYLQR